MSDLIKNLVRLVGSTAGIILFSIGAVMVLNSVLKLYVFGIEHDEYFNPQEISRFECESKSKIHDMYWEDRTMMNNLSSSPQSFQALIEKSKTDYKKSLTPEELAQEEQNVEICKQEAIAQDAVEYKRRKQSLIADGLAFLIVGTGILVFYRNRKPLPEVKKPLKK